MKLKHIILSSIFWRSLYFITVLLLNIIVSRLLQAEASGWIYYIINYLAFILLLASFNLESGMVFYASKNKGAEIKLSSFALIWTIIVSLVLVYFIFATYRQSEQAFTKYQFVLLAGMYITGILLTTFFNALFSAQQHFALPNLILVVTNVLLIIVAGICSYFIKENGRALFVKLYFLNFLLQGVLIFTGYLIKNKIPWKWSMPELAELKMIFRYSVVSLIANIFFFLLYRIDYWFIKNICITCGERDLGNYIQVSKLGQVFLLVPTFIASAVFPRTAAGFTGEMNALLPRISGVVFSLYLILLMLLVATGYWLFPFIYGRTFDRMYFPFLLLIPGILSLSSLSVISAYFAGKNKVAVNVKGVSLALAIMITGDLLFIPAYGIYAAAMISSVAYLVYYIYSLMVFKKEVSIPLRYFFIPGKTDIKKVQNYIIKNLRIGSNI